MSAVLILTALAILVHTSSCEECPSLPAQLGLSEELDISAVSVFLDPQQLPALTSRFYLIEDGSVSTFFDSLTDLTDAAISFISSNLGLAANVTSVPVKLASTSTATLYYSLSLFSLEEEVAPAACPSPQVGVLQPNSSQNIDIQFSCVVDGFGIQQACLTVGNQPFSSLNGTYHTFTFFFPLFCTSESPRSPPCAPPSFPRLLAEMCVTPNDSLTLVRSGAGSWSLLASVLRLNDLSNAQGYCIVDNDASPPGIILLLKNDSLNILYAIPNVLDDLEVYFIRSSRLDNLPLSYSVEPVSENTTVLDHPVTLNGVPMSGVTSEDRVDFVFDLRCKNSGVSRVFVLFNVTVVVDGIVYSNTYPDLYFYRNCSSPFNKTVVVVQTSNIALEVGVSLACCVVFIVIVGVAVTFVLVLLHFTRRNRKKAFLLEQEREMQFIASSNAYHMANFEKVLDGLKELDMEYNYACLELVDELGEGAFGRVFKAKAPGLLQEDCQQDFVAVKTLKEEADSDALAAFVAEVQTSSQFQHPNVVRLIGICSEIQKCMIFEYMDLGSLNDVLRRSDPTNPDGSRADPTDPDGSNTDMLKPDHFLSCCVQVAQGLSYLASLKFVHRDIATRNCLVNSNFVMKIADFGMSREVCADYYTIGSAKACLPVRWMPPEALLYGKFTVKSDVWSFGVFMWEVYTYARQPYSGISNYEVIDRIKAGQVLDCPDLCPASVYDIMKSCWTRVPQRRPTMARILTRMGHLVRSNSMNALDDYMTMGSAEGYLNLAFGTVAGKQELEEMKRIAVLSQEGGDRGRGHTDPAECEQQNEKHEELPKQDGTETEEVPAQTQNGTEEVPAEAQNGTEEVPQNRTEEVQNGTEAAQTHEQD